MKKLAIAGFGLALLMGGVAVAQTPPGPPPAGPQAMEADQQGAPQGEHEGWHHGGHGRGMEMMHGHRPPPPFGKAAFFRFRKGDASVAIKCAEDEPTKACVDAAAMLLDKLNPAK